MSRLVIWVVTCHSRLLTSIIIETEIW